MQQIAREIYATVAASRSVSDAQKVELGIHVRASKPAPIPRPSAAPRVQIISTTGHRVRLRIVDADVTRKGKAPDIDGATIISYVGDDTPSERSNWRFECNTTRSVVEIGFADTLPPGTQVWVSASFFNHRKQQGPGCTPISTHIQGGPSAMAA